MFMKLKDGKSLVVTLSYDDGVIYDKPLIEILDKYGLKATFNVDSGRFLPEDCERVGKQRILKLSEAKELYIGSGHEIAVHTLTHPQLPLLREVDIITEVIEDRKNIEAEFGVVARGMAYPYGAYSDKVVDVLRRCGICYARTTVSTETFGFPTDWLTFHPTCRHKNPRLMELAHQFIEKKLRPVDNRMFFLWGHSYEFNDDNNWEVIEEFAKYIGGREDVWYATNIEVYDYVKAYERLEASVDGRMVYNPSAIDVWFSDGKQTYCVKGGQTLVL